MGPCEVRFHYEVDVPHGDVGVGVTPLGKRPPGHSTASRGAVLIVI